MGPVMNLVLAVVLTASCCIRAPNGSRYEDQPVVVGAVTADSPAAQAGIQPGDRIVVGRRPRRCKTWEDFYLAVGTQPNRESRRSASSATARS